MEDGGENVELGKQVEVQRGRLRAGVSGLKFEVEIMERSVLSFLGLCKGFVWILLQKLVCFGNLGDFGVRGWDG